MFERTPLHCTITALDVRKLRSIDCLLKFIKFRAFLINEKIDIMQTFFFDSNLFGILAARAAGVNKIISSRRDMGFWYTPGNLRYLAFANRFTDRFLVNSEAIKENMAKIEKVDPSKIDVIYNGLDIGKFTKGSPTEKSALKHELRIPDGDVVVGCVAGLNRKVKRVDLFIEAASIVSRHSGNITFLVIGDGPLRPELEAMSRRLGLEKKVIFAGQRNDITKVLRGVDIGVLTSDSEGFSNSIMEYMAAGIPAIASDAGGNRELIDHGLDGFLSPPGDADKFAEAITRLAGDETTRLAFGERGRSKIERLFSMQKVVNDLELYYTRLINPVN
jgi:glycosyltransferase involved in cell wall biosynthesis